VARTTVGTFLLALLVLTAGCNAPFGQAPDAGETPTVTPVPVAGGPSPDAAELAPGLGPGGVTDPERLVDAHSAVLENESYTARLSSRREGANGSGTVRYDRLIRVAGPDRFHYVLSVATPGGDRRIERWRDGATAREVVTENGSTTRHSIESPPRPSLVTRTELLRLFSRLPSSVVDTRKRNGTTGYRVAGGPRDLPPLSNITFAATITGDGLVRWYEVSYTVERRSRQQAVGERETVTVEASISDVGSTTVEPPQD
jgi:hypothetical protein